MAVLCFVVMTLLLGLVLNGMDESGAVIFGADAWRIIQFCTLLIAHNMAGVASWEAHYHGFGNRLTWLIAIALHALAYSLNWEIYASLVLTDDSLNLIPNLAALGLIIIPSFLVFGGPFNALINPPPRARRNE